VKQLLVTDALCSGCRACEVACVARHDGRFGTASARIRVFKDERLGVDSPRVCGLCADAPCVPACSIGALSRGEATRVVHVAADQCTSCAACSPACPYGALAIHPRTGMPLICDLCDGAPACVTRCVTGALVYGEADDAVDPSRLTSLTGGRGERRQDSRA